MSEQFSLNCRRFATVDWTSLNGSRGLGFYRLFAQIRITMDAVSNEEITKLFDRVPGYARGRRVQHCKMAKLQSFTRRTSSPSAWLWV